MPQTDLQAYHFLIAVIGETIQLRSTYADVLFQGYRGASAADVQTMVNEHHLAIFWFLSLIMSEGSL
jgi:hypothetical protein